MKTYRYGNPDASVILLQPVDDHDLASIETEYQEIRKLTDADFGLIAGKVGDWNRDLSPWRAPAVFGDRDFGDGAAETLKTFLSLRTDAGKTYIIGGYSLAGLFALWVGCQTDAFAGVAAASPSVWFPDFIRYMREHRLQSQAVYLSLGDREEKTRNPMMATVGKCIREAYDLVQSQGCLCTLAWNPGNHFKDADLRTARAFAWVMKELTCKQDRRKLDER